MVAPKCGTSHLMTGLITWRNVHGEEENWLGHKSVSSGGRFALIGRAALTEMALPFVMVAAFVEALVYRILSAPMFLLYPITSKPFTFFHDRANSGAFTVLWGAVYFVFGNLFYKNVYTRECLVRRDVQERLPAFINVNRIQDQLETARLVELECPILEPYLENADKMFSPEELRGQEEAVIRRRIEAAAVYFKEMISRSSPSFVADFKGGDSTVCVLTLIRAVGPLLLSDERDEDIPDFFCDELQQRLEDLRRSWTDDEATALAAPLEDILRDKDSYFGDIDDATVLKAFLDIRKVFFGTHFMDLFLERIWRRTVQLLEVV